MYSMMHCTSTRPPRYASSTTNLLRDSGLVALRVYAYWGRSRRVLLCFAILWSIAFIATTVEATLWLTQYKGSFRVHEDVDGANETSLQGRLRTILCSSFVRLVHHRGFLLSTLDFLSSKYRPSA